MFHFNKQFYSIDHTKLCLQVTRGATTDQEGGAGPGEGGASIEEGSGPQDIQLSLSDTHDLLLERNLPGIQLDDLAAEKG